MLNIEAPASLTNMGLRKLLRTISLSVASNHRPIEFTSASDGNTLKVISTFENVSDERYQIDLELKPVE
ncbi:MAG: hypothetical protein IJQ18_08510 [Paludibacteraceae bacterium]|nr:hypothetical protein [Paludibacteraceae bacterium]